MERKAPPQHQNSNKDTVVVPHNKAGHTGASHFYLQDHRLNQVLQKKQSGDPAASRPVSGNFGNAKGAGLPGQLKAGIEGLSGLSMDDVKVHYNSDKPAKLNALAYAQGTVIHLAPGHEKHLPHEAWHVAQQKQGRVKPTLQMKGIPNVNDDKGLEREADVMGAKALQRIAGSPAGNASLSDLSHSNVTPGIIQYVIGPGGMLHAGRRVKGPGNVIYRIIGPEQFLGKLNYRLKDDDGNEIIRPFDDAAFNLVPFGGPISLPPSSDKRDKALHSEDEGGYDSSDEESSSESSTGGYSSDEEEEEAGSHDDEEEVFDDDEEQLPDVVSDEEIEVEEPYTPKSWTLEEIYKRLAESTIDKPLHRAEIEDIEKAVEDKTHTSRDKKLSRDDTRKLGVAIGKAKKDLQDHAEMDYVPDVNKKKRTRTKKSDKIPPSTFSNEVDSESSDEEYDPDVRLRNYALSMTAVSNRSHVPGLDEIDRPFRNLVTGLPHADTYLGLFKGGQLVPRNVNGVSNATGMRKRMRDVEAKIKPELKERDKLMLELDALGKGKKRKAKKTRKEQEKIDEIRAYLAEKIRPHVEGILFGSSIRPVEEDYAEARKLVNPRKKIKKDLRLEVNPSAASQVLTRRPPTKLSSGKDSHTHAEQALISTRTWISLFNKLVKQIGSNKDQPEKLIKLSFNTLQLVLNRSTCVGCARELTVELIRFWQTIAQLTAKNTDWRAAKQRYEGYVNFLLDFPAIYEIDDEEGSDYVNLQRIILGLRDAGWTVRITTGIKGGKKSNKKNARIREFAESVSTTPMFHAQGWNPTIVCFVPPKNLKGLKVVLVNGIAYTLTKDGKYLAVNGEAAKPSNVDGYKFVPTGLPNVLKSKKRIGGGGPPGDPSDASSSSDHSSSEHSSDDEEESSSGSSSEFEEEEEEYSSDPESDRFDTGRIMHEQNTCYLSALIHLFASHARLSDLFRPTRVIPLEAGPDANLLIRQADREKGEAIQMASRVGEAILTLRDPRGVVTKKTMADIMTFLGLIGGIIDASAPVVKTKTPQPKELAGKATVMSEEMMEKDKKARTEKSIEIARSLRRDKMTFTKRSRPASWGVQQDAAEVLVKMLSYLQPGNDLKLHLQSRLGPNADAGFAGGTTNIQESTLQLPIGRDTKTIQDALTKFSAVEQVNDFKHGGGDITVAKQVKFTSMPTILTIVLKRFSFNAYGVGQKITKRVKAPTLLTIPAVCLAGDLEGQVIRYRLVHFVEHSGGYGGGHYLSHVKNMSDEWHKHDDMGGKRTMHTQETYKQAKNQSYIYVYEKVNRF
ncbi:DUF4157 domain-containing protein [Mucilaginibacter sp. AK015]|uniref:eCIS core domain-containing protein n=1 Tax=Mucilaginibacter sp. AK015 TaxID=2723072 RepID=UPI0016122DD9|nr:DUF4157 domain-containing protein [Mucilaginibacter sp. AK015]MBB5395231.1 hypothetical protein [Mucilaginibacter sp. AK015]